MCRQQASVLQPTDGTVATSHCKKKATMSGAISTNALKNWPAKSLS